MRYYINITFTYKNGSQGNTQWNNGGIGYTELEAQEAYKKATAKQNVIAATIVEAGTGRRW